MRTTLHQCEAGTAMRAAGVPEHLRDCHNVGIIFTHDPDSYGRWVCEQHRRVFHLPPVLKGWASRSV